MESEKPVVTSRQNRFVAQLCALEDKKARENTHLFRFDGVKLLCEAVRHGVEIAYAAVCEKQADEVWNKLWTVGKMRPSEIGCKFVYVSESVFKKISEEKAPEGIICAAKHIDKFHKSVKIYNKDVYAPDKSEKILLLDSVRDPSNVGAAIRSAAAFGADRIIMGGGCADIYNPKTIRASMGTLFGMKIDRVSGMKDAVLFLRNSGRKVYAAALGHAAKKLGHDALEKDACVIIGNEGHGLSDEVISACTGCVYIPMSEGVESLNASVAAAVIMWEFFGKYN